MLLGSQPDVYPSCSPRGWCTLHAVNTDAAFHLWQQQFEALVTFSPAICLGVYLHWLNEAIPFLCRG